MAKKLTPPNSSSVKKTTTAGKTTSSKPSVAKGDADSGKKAGQSSKKPAKPTERETKTYSQGGKRGEARSDNGPLKTRGTGPSPD
ncbi:MAG: hypothetical protein ACRYFR_14605 [Janthinobacterium lividum]